MEIIIFIILLLILIINVFLVFTSNRKNTEPGLLGYQNTLDNIDKNVNRIESSLRDDIYRFREESTKNQKDFRDEMSGSLRTFNELINANAKSNRDELTGSLKNFEDKFSQNIKEFNEQQKYLTQTLETKLESIRETIENRLKNIQDDNSQKLEKMRETVDEKLHSTLEKRLGESFKQVSDRLDAVHKGLGEMQVLATGVGDLKKVLSNIKTRGVFGEYQLENILEQLLAPEQYAKNVKTKSQSNAMVEFAVKFPGRQERDKFVWLPIDAKFPTEYYHTLMTAYEQGNPIAIEEAKKALSNRIKACARDIKEKYIDPPNTTDFGIMFLPFEGLYAEVLRNEGLFEVIQREFKITITGPTTISAFLNSLQMGFRTLAIEKRSSEVWELLSAVKTEFSKFGIVLDKTKKKLEEAHNTIESASQKSRAIEKRLKNVQALPSSEELELLNEPLLDEPIEEEAESTEDITEPNEENSNVIGFKEKGLFE